MIVVAHDKIHSKRAEKDVIYKRLLQVSDNKTELLPGLFLFVPDMHVFLTDHIARELRLLNGTQGIFCELICDDQENDASFRMSNGIFPPNTIYIHKPLYVLVEISTSHVEATFYGLLAKLIPISPVKKGSPFLSNNFLVHCRNRDLEEEEYQMQFKLPEHDWSLSLPSQ